MNKTVSISAKLHDLASEKASKRFMTVGKFIQQTLELAFKYGLDEKSNYDLERLAVKKGIPVDQVLRYLISE